VKGALGAGVIAVLVAHPTRLRLTANKTEMMGEIFETDIRHNLLQARPAEAR
jgi:hypothetical protein